MRHEDASLANMILSRMGFCCDIVSLENHGFALKARQQKKDAQFEFHITGRYGNRAKIKVYSQSGSVVRVSTVRVVDVKGIRRVVFGQRK